MIDLTNNNEDTIEKNNFKKILINNMNKIEKDENINTYTNRPRYNNTLENDLLFHSYINNNSYNLIKQTKAKILKRDLDSNKYFNTIDNENEKEKYENAFKCYKLLQNKKKKNNENNSNINKIINKSILNDLKSKSLLKNKENSNRNKYKNIINISNSTGTRKNNNSNTKKKC